MNERISNKLLAIPITISFSIIALFCIFCIGLSKVEAKSYSWTTPYILDIQNYLSDTDDVIARCRNTNTCQYTSTAWGGNYGMARYAVSSNISNTDTKIEANTYRLEFSAELWSVGQLVTPTLNSTIRLLFYTGTGTGMSRATCDGGEKYSLTMTEASRYEFHYSCNELLVNRSDITHFGVVFGSSDHLFYKVSMLDNLKFIGPGESTNDDIINNNDKNTQNIINNQNQNTQDVINNMNEATDKINQSQQQTNENLQDIEDALTDETAPNLDAFDNMSGWLPPGPLDSVLNIPLNILNGLVGAFSNNTCSAISIPIPFIGGNLQLPCLYNLYSSINGLSIALTTFFTAISGYLMFKYLSNLYVWIDQTLKMEETSYMRDWGGV